MSNEFSPPALEPGVTPNVPGPQKTFNWFWLLPVALILILAFGFYIFYAQNVPPYETGKDGTPATALPAEEDYPSTPASTLEATPSLTSSDSFSDIERDLGSTSVDAGRQDFADLQTDLQGL